MSRTPGPPLAPAGLCSEREWGPQGARPFQIRSWRQAGGPGRVRVVRAVGPNPMQCAKGWEECGSADRAVCGAGNQASRAARHLPRPPPSPSHNRFLRDKGVPAGAMLVVHCDCISTVYLLQKQHLPDQKHARLLFPLVSVSSWLKDHQGAISLYVFEGSEKSGLVACCVCECFLILQPLLCCRY